MSEDRAQRIQVALDGVGLTLGGRLVFRDLSCEFPRGEITVVLGGSGAGKSTILRLIGGLQRPDRGRVCITGDDITHLFGVPALRHPQPDRQALPGRCAAGFDDDLRQCLASPAGAHGPLGGRHRRACA